jgi:hypothetical protein
MPQRTLGQGLTAGAIGRRKLDSTQRQIWWQQLLPAFTSSTNAEVALLTVWPWHPTYACIACACAVDHDVPHTSHHASNSYLSDPLCPHSQNTCTTNHTECTPMCGCPPPHTHTPAHLTDLGCVLPSPTPSSFAHPSLPDTKHSTLLQNSHLHEPDTILCETLPSPPPSSSPPHPHPHRPGLHEPDPGLLWARWHQ